MSRRSAAPAAQAAMSQEACGAPGSGTASASSRAPSEAAACAARGPPETAAAAGAKTAGERSIPQGASSSATCSDEVAIAPRSAPAKRGGGTAGAGGKRPGDAR